MEDPSRHLAAICFADIVGYTTFAAENENAALRLVDLFQDLVHAEVENFGGRLTKFLGDGALLEFTSAGSALRAAFRLQHDFARRAAEVGLPTTLRIGIHVGEIIVAHDGDLYGDGINVASRLHMEAGPGQVVVSGDVRRLIRGRPEFRLRSLGTRHVKGLTLPIEVHVAELTKEPPAVKPAALSGTRFGGAIDTARAHWPRLGLLTGVVVLVLAAAAVIWKGGIRTDLSDPPASTSLIADPAHIAVLTFNALGDEEDLAAFAAQLQGRLIDGLSAAATGNSASTRRLRVLSQASMVPFTNNGTVDLDSLRERLTAGTVLDGTVEQVSGALRVRVRLVDTQTGDQIYTSTAETRIDDRVALLDAVADSVVRLVRVRLGPVVREHIRLLETRSRAAFDRHLWATRQQEEFAASFERHDYATAARVLNEADSLFAEAERFDPSWIEPIVARGRQARLRALLARTRGDSSAIVPAITRGIRHAERALALNPSDWRGLELRGELRHYQLQIAPPANELEAARLSGAAERDLTASLVRHPSPAKPLRMLSELARLNGHMQQALTYGRRGYEEDPFMEQVELIVFRLFEYSFGLRQDAEAVRWCAEGRTRFALPVFHDCRLALGAWSDALPLSPDSAWMIAAAELEAYPQPLRPSLEPRLHAMVAAVLARHSLHDSARTVLASARHRQDSPGMRRAVAGVQALLGEVDSAFETLRDVPIATPAQRTALAFSPELRTLASDRRFQRLLMSPPSRQD